MEPSTADAQSFEVLRKAFTFGFHAETHQRSRLKMDLDQE